MFLGIVNDVTKPTYHVSSFALSEFRRCTNFKEVENKDMYNGSSLVVILVSQPSKRLYASINRFSFQSQEKESYLKSLVRLPKIKSEDDVQKKDLFFKKHGLKECFVDMNINNISKKCCDLYLEKFKKKHSSERKLLHVRNRINDEIIKYYYDNHYNKQRLFVCDLTLETMLEYSNFEDFIISESELSPEQKAEKLRKYYEIYRYMPKLRILFDAVKFHPRFEVNGNVLTVAQEKDIAKDINNFRSKTNIMSLLSDESESLEDLFKFYQENESERKLGIFEKLIHTSWDPEGETDEHVILVNNRYNKKRKIASDNNQPSTSFECKIKPIVGINTAKTQTKSIETISLTEDEENVEDIEDEITLEDKLYNINDHLALSKSYEQVVRDYWQKQMYLTATEWKTNKIDYMLNYLISNLSVQIVCCVQDEFKKEEIVGLINDYLSSSTEVYINADLNPDVSINDENHVNVQTDVSFVDKELITDSSILDNVSDVSLVDTKNITVSSILYNVSDVSFVDTKHITVSSILDKVPDVSLEVANNITVPLTSEVLFVDANDCIAGDMIDKTTPFDKLDVKTCNLQLNQVKIEPISSQNLTDDDTIEFVDYVPSVIEILSDSVCLESILCNEFNSIDDTATKSFNDIYLKSAEQIESQQLTVSGINDSKLKDGYGSLISLQDLLDNEKDINNRKRTLKTINRIESSMNVPPAKKFAVSTNITVRKDAGVKCSPRNIYINDSSSEDITQPIQNHGNIDINDHINEVLNHEYSVFLSSQIEGCDDYENDTNKSINKIKADNQPINFIKQLNSDVTSTNYSTACFYVKIISVKFQKDVLFHVTLNIPQFNFYSIDIENDNIKILLNLNEIEWKTLKRLLNLTVFYNYNDPERNRHVRNCKKTTSNSTYFSSLLDRFFETITSFKIFYLNSNDNSLTCINAEGVSSCINYDLSSTINPSILEAMKRIKATGRS